MFSPLSSTRQVPHICRTTKELSSHLPFSSHASSKMTQFPSHDFLLSPLGRSLSMKRTAAWHRLHPPLSTKQNCRTNHKLRGKWDWWKFFSSDERALERDSLGQNHWKRWLCLSSRCITNYPHIWWFILLPVLWVRDSDPQSLWGLLTMGCPGMQLGLEDPFPSWPLHTQVQHFYVFGPSVSTGHVLCRGCCMRVGLLSAWWSRDSCPSIVTVF